MSEPAIFTRIFNGEIPGDIVVETEKVFAIRDINPQAPTHILVIPKEHIDGVDALNESNSAVVSHIFVKIAEIAKNEGLTNGYRVVSNIGEDGGQTVRHLHFHILGGEKLSEKMS